MAISVSDHSSNAEENIAHAATIIGRSVQRRDIFDAIYTGKRRVKTVAEISKVTRLSEKRVLEEGKKLSDNHLVTPLKVKGRKAYGKIDFFHSHKQKIIALASSPAKLKKFPTKRNPVQQHIRKTRITIDLAVPTRGPKPQQVTIDDIESFRKVRKLGKDFNFSKIPETKFKNGVAKILGEKDHFKDWGGENRDLSTTRLKIKGKRYTAAFAFKGPGKTGRLTPGKMGKNGDQIQRLIKCPATVFFVQYWAAIDDSVLEQLEKFAMLKTHLESRSIMYGIIDGIDSTRLIQAYPNYFGQ